MGNYFNLPPFSVYLTFRNVLLIIDNMGLNSQLVHPKTIEEINLKYPRNKWTGCFANVVKTEIKLKPWSHTTSMGPSEDAIVSGVLGNKLMEPYD